MIAGEVASARVRRLKAQVQPPPRQGGLLTRDFDLDRFRMTLLPKIFVWTLCTPFTAFTNAEANAVSDRLPVRLNTRLV